MILIVTHFTRLNRVKEHIIQLAASCIVEKDMFGVNSERSDMDFLRVLGSETNEFVHNGEALPFVEGLARAFSNEGNFDSVRHDNCFSCVSSSMLLGWESAYFHVLRGFELWINITVLCIHI